MKKILLVTLAPLLAFAASPLALKFSTDTETHNGNIIVSVTNTSKQDLEVLKWNTPFEKTISADIFDVSMGKTHNIYIGRSVKRTQPQDKDYMLVEAGASERVSISMSSYYEMKKKGEYKVNFEGKFKYRLLDTQALKINEMAKKSIPSITISFIPSKQKRALSLKQIAKFNTCSQNEVKVLKLAHDDAIKMSKEAMDVLKKAPKKTTSPRYITWFGKADETRQKKVTEGFTKMYDAFENKDISFDCGTCKKDELYETLYAYVYKNSPYQVYLCGAFWNSKRTGTDSQAGTLVHELSHFTVIAGTDDHAYGQEDAKKLAKNTPEKAVNNAENYDYFAENNPNLSMDSADNTEDPVDNNETNNTNPDNGDISQEDTELDVCYAIVDDTKFEECYATWENKYYPYDNNETNNTNPNNSDISQEDAELDTCYAIVNDTKFEECYTTWENKYYSYNENEKDDDWNWENNTSNDELAWNDINWNYKG